MKDKQEWIDGGVLKPVNTIGEAKLLQGRLVPTGKMEALEKENAELKEELKTRKEFTEEDKLGEDIRNLTMRLKIFEERKNGE